MIKRLLVTILLILSLGGTAWGYVGWEPDLAEPIQELEALIKELDQAILRATEGNSAHPAFLQHLRELQIGLTQVLDMLDRDRDFQWGDYVIERDVAEPEELTRVLGNFYPVSTGGWETDRATPALALWEDKLYSNVAIEATVTFLGGNKEVNLGLYQREGYMVAMGGTGVGRSKGFVGAGDARNVGKLWEEKVGPGTQLEFNRPYRLRVEIRARQDMVRIDLYLDGERLLTQQGEAPFQEGYVAIRTWASEARIEDLLVEELTW
ncbi:MAG: DUF6250 domain-containing protein [Limnochordia bacterium]